MDKKLVTVGIPSYNHGKYIGASIESVLMQRDVCLELVIVDDCSTDNSWHIIQEYARNDSRIVCRRNPYNIGPSKTTQNILDISSGYYYAPLASDDTFAVDKLKKQYQFMETHPDCGMVVSGVEFINSTGEVLERSSHFASSIFDNEERTRSEWLKKFFVEGNCICAASVLIRKRLFQQIKPDIRLLQLQDLDIWVRLLINGFNIGVIKEKLTNYRILEDGGNLSSPNLKVRQRDIFEFSKILDRYRFLGDQECVAEIIGSGLVKNKKKQEWKVEYELAKFSWSLGGVAHQDWALNTVYHLINRLDGCQLEDESIIELLDFYNMMASNSPTGSLYYKTPIGRARYLISQYLPVSIKNILKKCFVPT